MEKEIDFKEFLQSYGQNFGELCLYDDDVEGFDEALESYEEASSRFPKLVEQFQTETGRKLSDDREKAAFVFAVRDFL